jgi:hypothetical protein
MNMLSTFAGDYLIFPVKPDANRKTATKIFYQNQPLNFCCDGGFGSIFL